MHTSAPPPNPGNNQNKFQVKAKLQSPNATSPDQTVPCERMTRRRQLTTSNTLKVNSCEMFKYSVKIKAYVGNPERSHLPGLMDIGQIPLWGLQNPNRSQVGRPNTHTTPPLPTGNSDIRMDGMQAVSLKYTFHTIWCQSAFQTHLRLGCVTKNPAKKRAPPFATHCILVLMGDGGGTLTRGLDCVLQQHS